MAEPLSRKLDKLAKLSKTELIAQFCRVFHTTPTQRASRSLLALMLAYRLQEEAHGGLSPVTRKQLQRLVQARSRGEALASPRPWRVKPGTRLVRTWKGQAHSVEALERGFEYQGKHYANLSEIARVITGTRWSGPAFFGLRGSKAEADIS